MRSPEIRRISNRREEPTLRALRSRIHIGASRLHKWLALFIGTQLLIWFASGALMSFLPIDKVRGEHLVDRKLVAAIPMESRFADLATISDSTEAPLNAVTWHMIGAQRVAEVTTSRGISLFGAQSGKRLPPIDAAQAASIATTAWRSAAKPESTVPRVTAEPPNIVARCQLGGWPLPTPMQPAFSLPPRPAGSLPFVPEPGGSTTSFGAFT